MIFIDIYCDIGCLMPYRASNVRLYQQYHDIDGLILKYHDIDIDIDIQILDIMILRVSIS